MKVLLIGSSIFERWQSASQGFPDANVTNKAVGGTTSEYWVQMVRGLLESLPVDLVCYYCGSNDFNRERDLSDIVEDSLKVYREIKRRRLDYVYYSIIKSPQKHGKYEGIDYVNEEITKALGQGDYFVDLNEILCDSNADVSGLYLEDRLHLTDLAYAEIAEYNRRTFWDDYKSRSKRDEGVKA